MAKIRSSLLSGMLIPIVPYIVQPKYSSRSLRSSKKYWNKREPAATTPAAGDWQITRAGTEIKRRGIY